MPDQLGTSISSLETRINLGCEVVNAHRHNREQRQKCRETDSRNGIKASATLTGKMPETAPTLVRRAGKSPAENGWALGLWWAAGIQTYVRSHRRNAENASNSQLRIASKSV